MQCLTARGPKNEIKADEKILEFCFLSTLSFNTSITSCSYYIGGVFAHRLGRLPIMCHLVGALMFCVLKHLGGTRLN